MNKVFIETTKSVIDMIKNYGLCDEISYDLGQYGLVIDMKYKKKHLDRFTADVTNICSWLQHYQRTSDSRENIFVEHICYPEHGRKLLITIDISPVTQTDVSVHIITHID